MNAASLTDRNTPTTLRLSVSESRRFAGLVRQAMSDCAVSSVYDLYLQVDLPRTTLHRWLRGTSRVPIAGGVQVVEALAERNKSSLSVRALRSLLDTARSNYAPEDRLRAELRARRVPIRRAIAALRAANVIPKGSQ